MPRYHYELSTKAAGDLFRVQPHSALDAVRHALSDGLDSDSVELATVPWRALPAADYLIVFRELWQHEEEELIARLQARDRTYAGPPGYLVAAIEKGDQLIEDASVTTGGPYQFLG